MERMVRKQIYISRQQDARLKRLAKRRGVSEAEIIRQALDQRLSGGKTHLFQPNPQAWEDALEFMMQLRARGPIPNQRRTWKREDAYEERESRYDRHSH